MKIRILLSALLVTEVAFGSRFDLPKENPQISIEMPDKWETADEGDNITSRPAKDSKVMISIFPVPAAKDLKDAFAIVLKHVSETYRDVKLRKLSEQKQSGVTFYGGRGEAERDGFELNFSVAALSADGHRYFALVWAADEASGDTHTKELDKTLASIQRFSAQPSPTGH